MLFLVRIIPLRLAVQIPVVLISRQKKYCPDRDREQRQFRAPKTASLAAPKLFFAKLKYLTLFYAEKILYIVW